MGHSFKLDRNESPSYTIEFEDGTSHTVDPFEVVVEMEDAGVVDVEGKPTVGQRRLIEKFREAIGLPELGFSDALLVMQDFERYVERAEKKLLGSPTSPQSTDGTQPSDPTPRPALASTATSGESARRSA